MLKFAKGALGTILFHHPLNARLWLTYRCNYRCRMCAIDKERQVKEMTLEDLKQAAENFKKMHLSQLVLTGGEALLREDIVDIIRLFSSYGFVVRLHTNGGPHATEELLHRCYAAGLNDICVSIDTLDADKQDRICQAKNVLANSLRVLKFCVKNYSDRGVVAANVVFSLQNYLEWPTLIKYIHDLGGFCAPCIYVRNFSESCGRPEGHGSSVFDLKQTNPQKIQNVLREVQTLIKKNYRILTTTRTIKALEQYIKTGQLSWDCRGGQISFDVLPTGELILCCDTVDTANADPVVRLTDKNFIKKYQSEEFQKKLKGIQQRCPGCLYGCYRDPVYLAYCPDVWVESVYKTLMFRKIFQ